MLRIEEDRAGDVIACPKCKAQIALRQAAGSPASSRKLLYYGIGFGSLVLAIIIVVVVIVASSPSPKYTTIAPEQADNAPAANSPAAAPTVAKPAPAAPSLTPASLESKPQPPAAALPSDAQCIDFEDVPADATVSTPWSHGGLSFTPVRTTTSLTLESPQSMHPRRSKALGCSSGIFVTRSDRQPFQIYSLDLSTFPGFSVIINGTTTSGSQTKLVNIPGSGVRCVTVVLDWSGVKNLTVTFYEDFDGQGVTRDGEIDNLILNTHHVPKVATPSASAATGIYPTAINVQLTCATPNAQVYYTLDGSLPTLDSTRYTGGDIAITKSSRLRTWAHVNGILESDLASYDYCIGKAVAPTITQQPQLTRVAAGAKLSIKVTGNPPPDVQWQRMMAGEVEFRNIPSGSAAQVNIRKIADTNVFRALVKNMAGEVISDPVSAK
jgi:hypothetical protein